MMITYYVILSVVACAAFFAGYSRGYGLGLRKGKSREIERRYRIDTAPFDEKVRLIMESLPDLR
jgi:hypothetical protein